MSTRIPIVNLVSKNISGSLGPRDQRIVVLGPFDTMPYLEFVCRRLIDIGYSGYTSISQYATFSRDGSVTIGREKMFNEMDLKEEGQKLQNLLREIIDWADKAVIVFSVPGAQYIETDWIYHRTVGIEDALGIAMVRHVGFEREKVGKCKPNCLIKIPDIECSACIGEKKTVFECKEESDDCPFQKQGIAKDVIERFFGNRKSMLLVAIQDLDRLKDLLTMWTSGELREKIEEQVKLARVQPTQVNETQPTVLPKTNGAAIDAKI